MLDVQATVSQPPVKTPCARNSTATSTTVSSRKRTRSRSEDDKSNGHKIQNINMTMCREAPYDDDPEAIRARDACDYSKKITYEMARSGAAPRKIRVYADGIYDLFHQGHARQLMQAKNIFPNVYLIVGVCNDELTHSQKGRTVMNENERYEALRHCRYVDEIVRNAPWEVDEDYINKHKIDFIAHDDIPYGTDDCNDIYAKWKAKGMFVATERTEGVSTSDIISRIVRDYDMYVRRNLSRGYSAKDLNIGYFSEKKIRFQNKMHEIKDKSKRVLGNLREGRHDLISKWEEMSREFTENFLLLFGKDRFFNNIWNESKGKIMNALSPPSSPTREGSPDGSSNNSVDGDYDDEGPSSPPHKVPRYDSPVIGRAKIGSSGDFSDEEN